jgi:hypothetical protein
MTSAVTALAAVGIVMIGDSPARFCKRRPMAGDGWALGLTKVPAR